MIPGLSRVERRVAAFKAEAHLILSKSESSPSRVIELRATRRKLTGLSLRQQNLFEEALDCVEHGLNRPAHVMAWAAFVDLLEEKLATDGLAKVHAARPGWVRFKSIEELAEEIAEYQLISVARDVGLIGKAPMKALHGLLAKRNECAHPSAYKPTLNETLGFVAELLNRAEELQNKSL